LADESVLIVEQDQMMHAIDVFPTADIVQTNAPWHLDRICRVSISDMDGDYYYRTGAGTGVTAYVIDTGILCTNVDFTKRCEWGIDATGEGAFDGNGHGTHVASIISGATYGVAKKVVPVAVKVLESDGSGTNSGVIAGIDWVTSDFVTRKKPSVVNMSLGGSKSQALDTVVASSIKKGLSYAIAAGNENQDACNTSPANVKTAVTVGSTELDDMGDVQSDGRSSFSNWGTCVDVFAPGSAITAAWKDSNTAIRTISGTSMASPVVCGVMALVLSDNPSLTPEQMHELIKSEATANVIDLACGTSANCKKSPNLLVYSRTTA